MLMRNENAFYLVGNCVRLLWFLCETGRSGGAFYNTNVVVFFYELFLIATRCCAMNTHE